MCREGSVKLFWNGVKEGMAIAHQVASGTGFLEATSEVANMWSTMWRRMGVRMYPE